MQKTLLATAALAAIAMTGFAPLPAAAQNSQQVLVIFGDDPCPTTSSGDEIVVCARKPESERYRIPQELRQRTQTPDDMSWSERASSLEYVGRTGTQSCSPVGPGGWTGCYDQVMRQAREERRQNNRAGGGYPAPPR